MDAGIGAFLQRAVVKTFGLPQFMPNTEPKQPTISQPESMIGCWPHSPKTAGLRRSHDDASDADTSGHLNKRARSASRLECSDSGKEENIPPTPQQETAPPSSLYAEDNDLQRSPLDTEDEPDPEPHLKQAGSQSMFFGEKSNDVQHAPLVLEGASLFSPCPEQKSPRRSRFPEEEDIFEEDQMCTYDLDQDTPLTRGPTRILTVNEDGKDRLAMIITDDIVATFNEIKEANEDIAKEVTKLKAAEREVCDLRIDIYDAEYKLGEAQDPNDAHDIESELKKLQSKLQKNEKRTKMIKKGMWPFESNLSRSTREFQGLFDEVLQAAAHFGQNAHDAQRSDEETEVEMDSEQHAEHWSNAPSDSQSQSGSGSESPLLSPEDLLRRSATADLEESMWILMEVQAKFDDRHAEYKQELADFDELIRMGETTYTRTDFDIDSIQYVQKLTTQLRDAESRYLIAKSQAKALGLSLDPYDDTVYNDGYQESQEPSVVAQVDRGRIETWSSKVATAEDSNKDDKTTVIIDEWDSKPVETTESCSVVDYQGYGGDIKVWQKHCDALRGRFIEPQPDDVWNLALVPMKRRRSI